MDAAVIGQRKDHGFGPVTLRHVEHSLSARSEEGAREEKEAGEVEVFHSEAAHGAEIGVQVERGEENEGSPDKAAREEPTCGHLRRTCRTRLDTAAKLRLIFGSNRFFSLLYYMIQTLTYMRWYCIL